MWDIRSEGEAVHVDGAQNLTSRQRAGPTNQVSLGCRFPTNNHGLFENDTGLNLGVQHHLIRDGAVSEFPLFGCLLCCCRRHIPKGGNCHILPPVQSIGFWALEFSVQAVRSCIVSGCISFDAFERHSSWHEFLALRFRGAGSLVHGQVFCPPGHQPKAGLLHIRCWPFAKDAPVNEQSAVGTSMSHVNLSGYVRLMFLSAGSPGSICYHEQFAHSRRSSSRRARARHGFRSFNAPSHVSENPARTCRFRHGV